MRYVYIALILLITLAVVAFKVQNIDAVTVSFLSSSITLPLSVLMFAVYFLGMATGGMVISVIRGFLRGATKPLPPRQ